MSNEGILDLTPLQEEKTASIKIGDDVLEIKIRDLYEQSKKPEKDFELYPEAFLSELRELYSELLGKKVNSWQTEILFNYAMNYVEHLFKKK